MKQVTTEDTWFIARNEDLTIIHYGYAPANTEIDTGQPVIEEFNNVEDWIERLAELGITPEEPYGPETE